MKLAVACIACLTMSFASAQLTPPSAATIPHQATYQGATINDSYFWLREKTNPEVVKYLEAENAYTTEATKDLIPFQDALYKEMLARIKQTDLSVPYRDRGYLYYSRTVEGKQYKIYCRKKGSLDAPEEVLLDQNEMAGDLKFLSIADIEVSDDGEKLAYSTDTTGFRQFTLHVKDLKTGTVLPDTAERVTSLAWASDSRTLFYVTEDPVTKRSDLLFRHKLGSPEYQQIYNEKDALFNVGIGLSHDRKMIFTESISTDCREWRYLSASHPEENFKVILPRERGHKYSVDHRDNLFYIRTNHDAKNYRVITAPVSDPSPAQWKEFLQGQPDVLIEQFVPFKNYAVAYEKSAALNRIHIYDFTKARWSTVPFPEPVYSAFAAENPEFDTHLLRYKYQSLITPESVFDYDMASGESTLLKRQEVLGGYDPSQYVSERLWATARDGMKVPISVVNKKGTPHDGTAPLFLYGYGSYGDGTPAFFSSDRVSLLDRGMIFAIAHIRGGDEMGETWHDDGMLMKKKNTFFDFIDSAEYLIQQKWTSKDRLVIEGRSAGGLLMGAVVNFRPDLFRAVHLGVPFVDVMNTMMDATLPLTVGEYLEWGNPNEKAAYDYMKTYSPYDNLEKRDYPAMLVTSSFNDSQVMYWEPAKYVARLRTLKTDKNPLIFKIYMDPAGHGGASGRYDRLKQQAFEYAWFLSEVGITQ